MNLSRDKFKMYENVNIQSMLHCDDYYDVYDFHTFLTYQIMNSSIVKSLAYPPWNRILVLYLYNVQTGVGQTFSVSLTNFATF